jgi:hypothetical protein
MKTRYYRLTEVGSLWSGNKFGKIQGNENHETTIPITDYDRYKTFEECGIF